MAVFIDVPASLPTSPAEAKAARVPVVSSMECPDDGRDQAGLVERHAEVIDRAHRLAGARGEQVGHVRQILA
jgi:hypothetical protein